ncbi:MAG: hypothetical protein F8N37_22150 [Telmatospirillum sp.]|nr:hypothetical protein [Telmatospirillum sp.]
MTAARLPPLPAWAGVFLLLLLAVKLGLLLALGPAPFPDSGLYLELGRRILEDPGWWRDGGWGSGFAPPALLRPYGYPLLIAAARSVAGPQAFGFWICALQCAASVGVLALFCRLALALSLCGPLLAAALLMAALSGFSLFDAALLTDSLYSVLFLLVLFILAAWMQGRGRPGPVSCLLLGLAWAASLSLRDVGLFHTVFPLAGLVLAARRAGAGPGRILALSAALLLPVVLFVALVVAWNGYRTGHSFYSITGGVNWLWPSVNIADRGLADPFACADAVCAAARAHGVGKGMDAVLGLADALWRDDGLDPVALGRVTFHHFLGVATAHPLAFVASVIGNMQPAHLADLAFNPLVNINEFCRLHPAIDARAVPALRELWASVRHGGFSSASLLAVPLLLLSAALAITALGGLLLFVAGAPLMVRRRGLDPQSRVILFLWVVAVLFVGSYSIVHMEMRHAMPVIPLVLLVTGWTLRELRRS